LTRRTLTPLHVNVAAVNITNFAFSPEFSKAIELKQVAQQRAQQAEYELSQKKVSAQERVVEAEAEANATVARAKGQAQAAIEQARGEAQATALKADAQAEANTQIGRSLTPAILQWRAMGTWDGKLPTWWSATAPLPFVSLDGKTP
jgi:regulator of protease activity HflC (stomatin/prohibitin superfamily)